jgi:hypothetical protein
MGAEFTPRAALAAHVKDDVGKPRLGGSGPQVPRGLKSSL